jgi:hypothetical protein
MALSLLFGRPEPTKIGEIELDASLSESHQFGSEVTQFPVEDGSVITDHIQNKPDQVSINGFVTNTPVRSFAEVVSAVDLVRPSGVSGRTELAFEGLERLHRERALVTIVTNLKTYDDMALTSLTIPRNAAIGDTLEFSADFVKVVKVTSAVVAVENLLPVNGADKQGSSTKSGGKQNTSAADEAQTNQGSLIARGFKAVFGG